MARQARCFLPQIPLHIIQRGNNKQACFLNPRDYHVYLAKLEQLSGQFNVAIHSFVLMTNHVHLLVTPASAPGPSEFMQALGRYYVRYFNTVHARTGTLWEGRFKAALVDSDRYFLAVSRYIELNPVRAGLAIHPADYRWSSYSVNAMGETSRMLTPHPLYLELGNSASARQAAYKRLFTDDISQETLSTIRTATNRALLIGDREFHRTVERRLARKLPPLRSIAPQPSIP